MNKKLKKNQFAIMCIMALLTVVSAIVGCVKENSETKGNSTDETTPDGYVDLGLPSGTLWSTKNKINPNDAQGFYTCNSSMSFDDHNHQVPTGAHFVELFKYCQIRGTGNGCTFTGPNGKSIFLPCEGYKRSNSGDVLTEWGWYWTSNACQWEEYISYFVCVFDAEAGGVNEHLGGDNACSLRLIKNRELDNGYVDLGLPSGTKWKASNEGIFKYYTYDWAGYHCNEPEMPTKQQAEELIANCTYTWDYGRKGGIFVSKNNGKSIFIPAEGINYTVGRNFSLSNLHEEGGILTSTRGWYLSFNSNGASVIYDNSSIDQRAENLRLVLP